MATQVLTPTFHQVYNQLDSLGLLLSTPRLKEETNVSYKQRLLDVFVHRANSTYLGLIYGITRELGLSLFEAIRIQPVMSGGSPLGTNPAVIFKETKCYIYSDVTDSTNGLIDTLDRYDLYGDYFTINDLIDGINNTGYFTATLMSGVDGNTRAMTIYDQGTTILIPSENIAKSSAIIHLDNKNLISKSIRIESTVITERVDSSVLLTKKNQYYIDTTNGILYTGSIPETGAIIRYKYRNDNFIAMASPVILHNLQSDDFKTKMFEQILQEDGTYEDGFPTVLGAELINELYSVYPAYLGA